MNVCKLVLTKIGHHSTFKKSYILYVLRTYIYTSCREVHERRYNYDECALLILTLYEIIIQVILYQSHNIIHSCIESVYL